jgi:YggT family protein
VTSFLVTYAQFIGLLRLALFGVAVVVAVICLLDWAVRTRRISPFGGVARFMRSTVDPLMAPIERRVVMAGGQPQSAPWWALGAVMLGGILVLYVLEFAGAQVARAAYASSAGPSGIIRLVIDWGITIVQFALIIRVVGSWFGQTRFSRWIGWTYRLTDWLVEPLRRVIPNIGMIDITPIVAYFALALLRGILLSIF